MARCASASMSPCTRIETLVPSRGRARSIRGKEDRIGGQQAFDAVRDMAAGEGCTGNVLNVFGERERCAMTLAGELVPPGLIANLAAIGFAVFQDLHRFDGAAGIEAQREGNEVVLAHHLVGDEPATGGDSPDLEGPAPDVDAGSLFDRGHLL